MVLDDKDRNIYIEFSHWQIIRGVSKGNLNIAVNMRATLPQTMV